ncbi:MAG TPA: tRNA (adenosine(37)-N6)-threonylcarbamoyltransferase complex ATPase subunit type 1 TsaE [Jatrophihabitans sp.]|jgi:tRNA threonylcarbamoyladenosine biosynthesis protein TsaE
MKQPRYRLSAEQRDALSTATVELPTLQETHDFGEQLASILRAGDLLVLTGPLGAGKTALVQGIGLGLGVSDAITSPTFVIARVHRGRLPLVHVDAYRLGSLDEVDDLDLDVDTADAVTAVEWGAGLVEQLAESRLEIALSRTETSEVRTVVLRPVGGDWAQRLSDFVNYVGDFVKGGGASDDHSDH